MSPRDTTLVGWDTLEIVDGMPMQYAFDGCKVKGLQRVLKSRVDALFLDRWSEFSFKYAQITGKKGICAYDSTRTIVVFPRTLNDREKVELAKQLLGE